jgi:putative ABC transport system substrate-binding protein
VGSSDETAFFNSSDSPSRRACAKADYIQPWEIRAVDDFEKVFTALNKQRPDGLYVITAGPVMRPNENRIADFALKSRFPSMYASKEIVEAGGLMSYGSDLADRYRHAVTYVDKIFKGAKPADVPVEQSTKFEFVINLKNAKQIELIIPPNVLARADKVMRRQAIQNPQSKIRNRQEIPPNVLARADRVIR